MTVVFETEQSQTTVILCLWLADSATLSLCIRYGAHGSKVTRHISFSERLDLRPFMSETKSPSVWYRLYAVLVHNGCTTNSGHYFCYVRAPGGTWHCMNDSSVSNVRFGRARLHILWFMSLMLSSLCSCYSSWTGYVITWCSHHHYCYTFSFRISNRFYLLRGHNSCALFVSAHGRMLL